MNGSIEVDSEKRWANRRRIRDYVTIKHNVSSADQLNLLSSPSSPDIVSS